MIDQHMPPQVKQRAMMVTSAPVGSPMIHTTMYLVGYKLMLILIWMYNNSYVFDIFT